MAWFGLAALVGFVRAELAWARWYGGNHARPGGASAVEVTVGPALDRRRVAWAMAILVALLMSKFFYTASMSNYYTVLPDQTGSM